jgi:hypothetical protein
MPHRGLLLLGVDPTYPCGCSCSPCCPPAALNAGISVHQPKNNIMSALVIAPAFCVDQCVHASRSNNTFMASSSLLIIDPGQEGHAWTDTVNLVTSLYGLNAWSSAGPSTCLARFRPTLQCQGSHGASCTFLAMDFVLRMLLCTRPCCSNVSQSCLCVCTDRDSVHVSPISQNLNMFKIQPTGLQRTRKTDPNSFS